MVNGSTAEEQDLSEEEEQRLRSIQALGGFDVRREERFDRITRLASAVFDVPIALITFMGPSDQWFKSSVGVDVERAPRATSFCDQTVTTGEVVVVDDARADDRFCTFPVVTGDPHLRFYAGFPVHDAHGTTIGTLCIFDRVPRTLDDAGRAIGVQLATWVESELQSSRDVRRARAVQKALLPATAPVLDGYASAALCRPATTVAGDFFDHLPFDSRQAFVVADVMGKGMGAAILMSTVRAVLRAELRALGAGRFDTRERQGHLGDVLTAVNDAVLEDLGSSQAFVTGFVGWAEPATGRVDYVDAGHGLAAVVRADGTLERLSSRDLPIGITGDVDWTLGTVQLAPGDHLVCFSDGLLDLLAVSDPDEDAFEVLQRVLAAGVGPHELLARVDRLVGAAPLMDDVTVLAIRREGRA